MLLVLLATIVFGPQVWEAFAASTQFTRTVALEAGDPGWHKIQSAFSWARMWGGSIAVAYMLQAAVTLVVGATLIWLWRSAASFALKASALCLSAMLASPYGYDYDMMILAPAMAFLASDGLAQGLAALGKNSSSPDLADADRRARDCLGDIHSAWRHRHGRGLCRDSAQRRDGAEQANAYAGGGHTIIPFATAKELFHLRELY